MHPKWGIWGLPPQRAANSVLSTPLDLRAPCSSFQPPEFFAMSFALEVIAWHPADTSTVNLRRLP